MIETGGQIVNQRRLFLGHITALLAAGPAIAFAEATESSQLYPIQIYKSSTCGCCAKWAEHMRSAGFAVQATDVADVNVYKIHYGVPPELASCHTALVEDYVVEGHVPAADVIKMLREKPAIKGIAVPGMPIGSPGMEGPNPVRYETLSFSKDGSVAVFAVHEPT
jgi:hypothetical protein